jgi:prophage regulatory protein
VLPNSIEAAALGSEAHIMANIPTNPKTQIDPLHRRKVVENVTGLSRSSIYAKIAEGTFPRPVQIGARAVAWRASDIRAWMDSLQEAGYV